MVIVAYLPPFAASQNSARNFSESCSLQHITFQASIVHHCICIYINICGICLRLRQRHSILFFLSFAFCWQQNWPHYSISDAFLLDFVFFFFFISINLDADVYLISSLLASCVANARSPVIYIQECGYIAVVRPV